MDRWPDWRTQKTQRFRRERKKYFCALFGGFCEPFAIVASSPPESGPEPECENQPYAR